MESEVPPARVPAMDRRRLLTAGAAGTVGLVAGGCAPESRSSTTTASSTAATVNSTAAVSSGLPNVAPNGIASLFAAQKVVPVLRNRTTAEAVATAQAWAAAGCRAIELTTTTPDVFSAVKTLSDSGLVIGVGTIRTPDQITQAADAGARFVLSFATFPALISRAAELGLTAIPGTMTPTEVFDSLAAPMVKIFPAVTLGVEYMAFIKVLFPGIRTVATGGLTADPVVGRAWLAAGADAIGPDGDICGNPLVEGQAAVAANCRQYIEAVSA